MDRWCHRIDGVTYTSSNNTAQHTLVNSAGCDSVVTLDLTISPEVNTEVSSTINSDDMVVLISDEVNAQYQWLDCNNNFSVIDGANNQTFLVNDNGSYAIKVTVGNCSDTSECITVDDVSLDDFKKDETKLYPNPSDGLFILESELIGKAYGVFDAQGRLVESGVIDNQKTSIQLDNEDVGMYFLKIDNVTLKMVKQ